MVIFTILVFLAASVGYGLKEKPSLDALHCVGCESLLIPKRVQELPYRWVLAGYQRVEGVVVGLQGVGCPGRARGYGGLNNSIILRCVDYLQGCNLRWIGKVGVRFSVL